MIDYTVIMKEPTPADIAERKLDISILGEYREVSYSTPVEIQNGLSHELSELLLSHPEGLSMDRVSSAITSHMKTVL